MTTNVVRSDLLAQALHAGINGDATTIRAVCTADVRVWTPNLSVQNIEELLLELDRRDAAFSDLDLTVFPLDVGGDFACVEWTVSMTHTGPLRLGEDTHLEPTGLRVTAIGVTVAEFVGPRICALRQYWDEGNLLSQLGRARR